MELLIVLLIPFAFLISSCAFVGGVVGSGHVISRDYELADFSGVDVGSAFQVNLVKSDSFGVAVSADDNLFDYIKVAKQGSTLRIYVDSVTSPGIRSGTLKADIRMPALDDLRLSGATRTELSGFSSDRDFHLNLSGASRLNGSMDMGNSQMEISGASQAALKGSAKSMSIRVSGASTANLADLVADAADIDASGASTATVNLKNNLSYSISGASHLNYSGNPKITRGQSSGASSISQTRQ